MVGYRDEAAFRRDAGKLLFGDIIAYTDFLKGFGRKFRPLQIAVKILDPVGLVHFQDPVKEAGGPFAENAAEPQLLL